MESDAFGKTSPHLMPAHFFISGTYVALDYDKIERANVDLQDFSVAPRHWYIDARIKCLGCDSEFHFSVDEQRVWYEEYQFFVDSFPSRCPRCRRAEREIKRLRQQYDESIAEVVQCRDGQSKRELVAVIERLLECSADVPAKLLERRNALLSQIRNLDGLDCA